MAEDNIGKLRYIAHISQFLFATFILITLLIPFFRADLNPVGNAVSHYLVGPFGGVAVASFILLGTGAFLALSVASKSKIVNKSLIATLFVYSIGVVLAGVSHPDSAIHGVGAAIAFGSVPLMVLLANIPLRYTWLFLILGSFLFWPVLPFGVAERVTTFLEVSWLMYFTHKIKRT